MVRGYSAMGSMFLCDLLLMVGRGFLNTGHIGGVILGAAWRRRRPHVVEVITDIVANKDFRGNQLRAHISRLIADEEFEGAAGSVPIVQV